MSNNSADEAGFERAWSPAAALRLLRFLAVGGSAAGLYVVMSTGLVELLQWRPWAASLLSYGISIPTAYIAQKRFTFASSCGHIVALPRYVALQIVGMIIAAAVAEALSSLSFLTPPLVFLLTVGAVAGITYLVMSRWIFGTN